MYIYIIKTYLNLVICKLRHTFLTGIGDRKGFANNYLHVLGEHVVCMYVHVVEQSRLAEVKR